MAELDPTSPVTDSLGFTTPTISTTPLTTKTSLDSLQSFEQLHLLNEIDKLRAYGVNDFVSLPQIVVCGDQSSGKSSVLEAITEIPFPRKDNLCTRFATQIVLRRGTKTKVVVKILPDSKRLEKERKKLEEFTGSLENFGDLPLLIEDAQEAMGIVQGSGAFSRDVLSIEISGPGRPQLTVVDLPGLTHTENKSQSREDVELVSELVQKYMTDPRTIVLAIVTAKNDYANQIILKRAKAVDRDGVRTLGIITKPDTLPEGSDSEQEFFSLAKNEDISFKLGWHVLRNRTYEERNSTFEDRNRIETAFFEKGVWRDLPRDCVGISALRTRLSSLLLHRIKQELPRVYKEIGEGLRDTEDRLSKLGDCRSTVDEQRVFLSKISEAFGRLCKAASDGIYEEGFFGDTTSQEGRLKRLRSVVQNLNSAFAENIRRNGHSKNIAETHTRNEHPPFPKLPESDHPQEVSRGEAIEWVKPLLLRSRGRELPGTYNPLLIGEVFWEQSKPWESIAQTHLNHVFQICQEFLRIILKGVIPGDVLNSLFNYWIDGKMRERFEKASSELKNLLTDRRRHAITYNHYYTENMQRARERRLEERYIAAIQSVASWDPNTKGPVSLVPADLLKALVSPGQESMDDYACEEVLDCMSAFYKVASKVFIDNVAIQVVERQVVSGLWEIFSSSSVAAMTPDMIANIAEESIEDRRLREQLEAKLKSLQMGMEVCRGALRGVKTAADASPNTQSSPGVFSSTPFSRSSFEELSALLAGTDIKGPVKQNEPAKFVLHNASAKPSTTPEYATSVIGGTAIGNRPVSSSGLFETKLEPGEAIATAEAVTGGTLFGAWAKGGAGGFGGRNSTPSRSSGGIFSTSAGTGGTFGTAAPVKGVTGSLFQAKPAQSSSNSFGIAPANPDLFCSEPFASYAYAERWALGSVTNHMQSIVATPKYQHLSPEELRLQDYEEIEGFNRERLGMVDSNIQR